MPESLERRPPRLAGGLALAAAALIFAGSLYPFSGWRDNGLPPWSFLFSQWPRYWTVGDLLVNVVAYVPLGALLSLAIGRRSASVWAAVTSSLLACAVLSLSVEWLQHYLPSRIPSKLDLLSNIGGALLGITLYILRRANLQAIENHLALSLIRVPQPSLGLSLLFAWQLTQLSADAVFATTGDFRRIFGAPESNPLAAALPLESIAVACHLVVAGLVANRLFGALRPAYPGILLYLLSAAAITSVTRATLLSPGQAFAWLTPATTHGLIAGVAGLLVALLLPVRGMRALTLLALVIGCGAINLLPSPPYQETALAPWQLGGLLNVNGLTRWLGALWPVLAVGWLLAGPWHLSRWHEAVFRRSL